VKPIKVGDPVSDPTDRTVRGRVLRADGPRAVYVNWMPHLGPIEILPCYVAFCRLPCHHDGPHQRKDDSQ